MQHFQQPAFVLHRRAQGETSLLVSFFTPEFGKLQANVRGVRTRAKSSMQKQAWLQPFQPLSIQWQAHSASSDWIYPRNYEPLGAPFLLQARANVCGLYLNELLYRLLQPAMAMENLYLCYHQTLSGLSQADEQSQAWLLRLFEWDLLVELGYEIPLLETHAAQPIDRQGYYRWQAGVGWWPSGEEDSQAICGDCLYQLAQRSQCARCGGPLKRLLRGLLQPHLGPKPLASRQLLMIKG
jgi:DNA repair protein RecO (recombination protein O)